MAIAVDASTPAFAAGSNDPWASASFTPPVGSLLVVVAVGDWFGSTPTLTPTSAGLSFTSPPGGGKFGGLNNGVIQIWTCEVGAAGGSARTVSVATTQSSDVGGVQVYVLTGYDTTQVVDTTGGNTGSPNGTNNWTPTVLTTGFDGCWVFGGAVNWVGGNLASTSTDVFAEFNDADLSVMVARKSAATSPAGPVTLNFDQVPAGTPVWTFGAISIRPDDAAIPTPMWTPARTTPPLPGAPLTFPFRTPLWAATDTVAAGPTGDAIAAQRSSTETTGTKTTAGAATAHQRTATTETGTKQTSGATTSSQRSSVTSTGRKNATGTATTPQRVSVVSTGRKNAAGAGTNQQRTTTTTTATKTSTGAATVQQRTATQSTGSSTPPVGGVVSQRVTTRSSGVKNAAGAAAARCRTSTTSAGVHRGTGSGVAATRTQSLSAGVHRGTGTGLVAARTSTSSSGVHRGTGVAAATCRTSVQTTGKRATAGAGRVQQRVLTLGIGEQVAPFDPLTDPIATVRGNDAAARPRTHDAVAAAGNTAVTGQRANLAAATARPNPAEGSTP